MHLRQRKCVSSFLFDGMIKFIGPLKTSGIPGIKVDVMEVTLPGLRPPGGGRIVLCLCLVQMVLFFLLAMILLHTIDCVGDAL